MPETNGSSRWISISGFQFQPSEFGKIIFILAISRFITDYRDSFSSHLLIISCAILTVFPVGLMLLQPDYGTSMVYILPVIPMLYWGNINTKKMALYFFPLISMFAVLNLVVFYIWMFVLTIVLILISKKKINVVINLVINSSFGLIAPVLWKYGLKPYHKDRIWNLLYPDSDPLGTGYQILQSKVAIGSGGIFGKGLGEGTQSYLRFLPIKDSDFILSVISGDVKK